MLYWRLLFVTACLIQVYSIPLNRRLIGDESYGDDEFNALISLKTVRSELNVVTGNNVEILPNYIITSPTIQSDVNGIKYNNISVIPVLSAYSSVYKYRIIQGEIITTSPTSDLYQGLSDIIVNLVSVHPSNYSNIAFDELKTAVGFLSNASLKRLTELQNNKVYDMDNFPNSDISLPEKSESLDLSYMYIQITQTASSLYDILWSVAKFRNTTETIDELHTSIDDLDDEAVGPSESTPYLQSEEQMLWIALELTNDENILYGNTGTSIPLNIDDPTEYKDTAVYKNADGFDDARDKIVMAVLNKINLGVNKKLLRNFMELLRKNINNRNTVNIDPFLRSKAITANIYVMYYNVILEKCNHVSQTLLEPQESEEDFKSYSSAGILPMKVVDNRSFEERRLLLIAEIFNSFHNFAPDVFLPGGVESLGIIVENNNITKRALSDVFGNKQDDMEYENRLTNGKTDSEIVFAILSGGASNFLELGTSFAEQLDGIKKAFTPGGFKETLVKDFKEHLHEFRYGIVRFRILGRIILKQFKRNPEISITDADMANSMADMEQSTVELVNIAESSDADSNPIGENNDDTDTDKTDTGKTMAAKKAGKIRAKRYIRKMPTVNHRATAGYKSRSVSNRRVFKSNRPRISKGLSKSK